MMTRLMALLGVDYEQWWALTKTQIKLDFRTSQMGSQMGGHRGRAAGALRWVFILFAVTSILISYLIAQAANVFFGGLVFLTYVMFTIGSMILIEYNSVVISPSDYAVLGCRPVSSRTYFFSRLANVLSYTVLMTAALTTIPIVTYAFTSQPALAMSAAAALAAYLATVFTALAMIVIYTVILRFVRPVRLRKALSYLQVLLSFFLYGGFALFPQLVDQENLVGLQVRKGTWIFFFPPAWFASFLDFARGVRGFQAWLPAALGLAAVPVLLTLARGRLSMGYAQSLSDASLLSTAQEPSPVWQPQRRLLFRRFEDHAVALLIRNQFRHDQRFRLAVLGIVPLTLFYLILALTRGTLADPFLKADQNAVMENLIYLVVLLFPGALMSNLGSSDSYAAAWIFHTTPADKGRVILAMKNYLLVYFLIPFLVVLAVVFSILWMNPLHSLIHFSMLGLLGHLVLLFSFLVAPQLPFSRPPRQGEQTRAMIFLLSLVPFFAFALFPFLVHVAYPSRFYLLLTLAALLGAGRLLEKRLRRRVHRLAAGLEFLN